MSHKPQIEAQIRDYLSRRVDRLPGLITNLCAIKEEHQARLDAFLRISEEQGGPTPTDLLRRILTKRNFSGPPRRESTGACDTFNCEPIDGKIVRSMVATVPPRVYLCYSRADALTAQLLKTHLDQRGTASWERAWEFDVTGPPLRDLVETTKSGDYLLVLLSPDALQSSWLRFELDARHIDDLETRGVSILTALVRDCSPPPSLAEKISFDFRVGFERTANQLADFIENSSKVDFSQLSRHSFERLIADLLKEQGFRSVAEVGESADLGFDFVGERLDPTGKAPLEKWLIETKFYREQRPDISSMQRLLAYAQSSNTPVKLLLVTNSQMTSAARNWLRNARMHYPIDIRIIEGPELKRLLLTNKKLVNQYFSGV